MVNDKVKQHKRMMDLIHETYKAKNHDYGDSFGETHQTLGPIAGVTRITDKYNRVVSLITKDNRKVENETLLDTLLDLANYSVMLYMELENDEKEGN